MYIFVAEVYYSQRETKEAIEIYSTQHDCNFTDDNKKVAGYNPLILTEHEYCKYYKVLDRPTMIKEIK